MILKQLTFPTPPDFDFWQTVNSHGWAWVRPHQADETTRMLSYTLQLDDSSVWQLAITAPNPQTLTAHADGGKARLTESRRAELERKIRWMFRFDEDYAAFYALCANNPTLRHVVEKRHGRVLRCATAWEDLVRVIATTNTTWTLTRRMIDKLVAGWGTPHPDQPELIAFPTPQVVANLKEEDLKGIGYGYRAAYIIENARRIVAGELDLEALARAELPDAAVRKQLLGLRGVGDYAAGTLMILFGRYTNVPVDTVARAAVSKAFFNGAPVTDKQVKTALEPYQPFAALALYCLSMVD